jgi:hypothetical protein
MRERILTVLFYAPLPFLLWAVFRFGARATSAAILMITFLAIWSSAHGHGPFKNQSAEINARSIQMFLIIIAVPIMLLAAGIQERAVGETNCVKANRASGSWPMLCLFSSGCPAWTNFAPSLISLGWNLRAAAWPRNSEMAGLKVCTRRRTPQLCQFDFPSALRCLCNKDKHHFYFKHGKHLRLA